MLPPEPVLITGGAGFIGYNLYRVLSELGCGQLRVLDLQPGDKQFAPGVFHAGDITRPGTLEEAFRGAKTVFHLAALARDWGPARQFEMVNAQGTANVLRAACRAGVRRLVHLSTLAVHPFRGFVDGDESTPRANHISPYCRSKARAEELVEEAGAAGWFETVIARPGVVIHGPGDTTSFVHLASYLMAGKMLLVEGGRYLTCYSDAENLARGLILCATHPQAAGGIFNIHDGLKITWREYLEQVCRALAVTPRFRSVPATLVRAAGAVLEAVYKTLSIRRPPLVHRYRAGLVSRDFHFSCARAEKMLGWKPQVDFTTSLRRTADWYLNDYLAAGSSRR